jgi:hypothetical protein
MINHSQISLTSFSYFLYDSALVITYSLQLTTGFNYSAFSLSNLHI